VCVFFNCFGPWPENVVVSVSRNAHAQGSCKGALGLIGYFGDHVFFFGSLLVEMVPYYSTRGYNNAPG
jgi:hypothetical protein